MSYMLFAVSSMVYDLLVLTYKINIFVYSFSPPSTLLCIFGFLISVFYIPTVLFMVSSLPFIPYHLVFISEKALFFFYFFSELSYGIAPL